MQLEERLRTFTTTVTSGNSVELKCDIRGSANIVWKRNGGLLDNLPNDEIKIFKDGSLYIRQLGYALVMTLFFNITQYHITLILTR